VRGLRSRGTYKGKKLDYILGVRVVEGKKIVTICDKGLFEKGFFLDPAQAAYFKGVPADLPYVYEVATTADFTSCLGRRTVTSLIKLGFIDKASVHMLHGVEYAEVYRI
jgi:hypothetical protein